MSITLHDLIYYPRTIGLFANGVFTGLGICMNFVSVPSIKATNDPLPVFYKTYSRASKIAILNIAVSTVCNAICYYRTSKINFLYASVLSFASAPFTLIFIAPINNQLFEMEKQGSSYDRKKVYALINKWDRLQYFRTISGTAAFILNLLYH
ncbi:uncharacterized protein BX663DRAFT_495884 [Cokeromyces recurvatus]|uniref:uncharacterized protein n=1 Tax=Cokeromyces recurvatus TaxID=90255 RepID=UPI00221E3AD6|nr:uncharacterized protein BX663DRAFT_495884 [Cokeromyces recurvatus]KAI7906282.1 hypothetical protein BX663DRAFT_495884 [Cokeromyces recurvatus]